MEGYTGKIIFAKRIKSDFSSLVGKIVAFTEDNSSWLDNDDDYEIVAESEVVSVEFKDTRQAEVSAIDQQIGLEKARHQRALDVLLGGKRELLAREG